MSGLPAHFLKMEAANQWVLHNPAGRWFPNRLKVLTVEGPHEVVDPDFGRNVSNPPVLDLRRIGEESDLAKVKYQISLIVKAALGVDWVSDGRQLMQNDYQVTGEQPV